MCTFNIPVSMEQLLNCLEKMVATLGDSNSKACETIGKSMSPYLGAFSNATIPYLNVIFPQSSADEQ